MKTKLCKQCDREFSITYKVTRAYWVKRQFCSRTCANDAKRGLKKETYGKPIKAIENRFWSKVGRRSEDECWNWIGALDLQGYGELWSLEHHRPSIKAHRLSF